MWLGTMSLGKKEIAKKSIEAAVKSGYEGIDTACVYGTKNSVGEALEELNNSGIFPRVQTKIWTADFEKNIKEVYLEHLKEIRQCKVYSLLLHRPSQNFGLSVKAWKELIMLKKEGLVEHIGVSNFDKDMIEVLIEETGVTPEFNQIELSVSNWRGDRVHINKELGIGIQAWTPLGNNIKANLENPIVKELALKYDVTCSVILLSFLTSQGISPVAGSSKPERVLANNINVLLTKEEIKSLLELNVYDSKYEETFPH